MNTNTKEDKRIQLEYNSTKIMTYNIKQIVEMYCKVNRRSRIHSKNVDGRGHNAYNLM